MHSAPLYIVSRPIVETVLTNDCQNDKNAACDYADSPQTVMRAQVLLFSEFVMLSVYFLNCTAQNILFLF